MTDIDKLEGRELDAAVAEARGMRRVEPGSFYVWPSAEMVEKLKTEYPDLLGIDYAPVPWFSTDMTVAWELVEELSIEQPSMEWSIRSFYLRDDIRMWEAKFWGLDDLDRDLSWSSEDRQLPTAICRAYLKAKGP